MDHLFEEISAKVNDLLLEQGEGSEGPQRLFDSRVSVEKKHLRVVHVEFCMFICTYNWSAKGHHKTQYLKTVSDLSLQTAFEVHTSMFRMWSVSSKRSGAK